MESKILVSKRNNEDIVAAYDANDFPRLGFKDTQFIERGSILTIFKKKYKIIDIAFINYKDKVELFGISECPELSSSKPFNIDIRIIVDEI